MQTLPVLIKHSDINKLNSVFLKFTWGGRRPCIALQKLMLPKEDRSFNFPNLRGYNLAYLLRYVVDWFQTANCFSNWKLESKLASPWPLTSLLHTDFSALPQRIKSSVTLRDTIISWKEVCKAFGLPFLLFKHMPLWGHSEFSKNNNHNIYYDTLRDKRLYLAEHFMHMEEKQWLSPS